ncbi:MAG TPA: divalent-cation tolerance protein CutA [Patescibacteria group bacterium]|nr:divalent-cation tolerance protein CutA [Patescibacteria group bacterium]
MILILSTFPNKEESHKVGKDLLNKKLIACYNLIPVESAYWWKGKIEEANEILLIIKTNKDFEEVEKFIIEHHSYETPEIVALEPSKVTEKYLNWVNSVLK